MASFLTLIDACPRNVLCIQHDVSFMLEIFRHDNFSADAEEQVFFWDIWFFLEDEKIIQAMGI